MRQLRTNWSWSGLGFTMARFTISSLKSPLPAWHSRSLSSKNSCSSSPGMSSSTYNSTFPAASFINKFHSSPSSQIKDDALRSTQRRLTRFRAAGLSNFGGKRLVGSSAASLRGFTFSPVNLKNNDSRASRRLICSRACSSSSAHGGTVHEERFDVVVVGGGHAGCEAALAAARMGAQTLLLTLNLDRIAWQPCNPAVGGPAKSQLVHEVDALGGEIGKMADRCYLQKRVLNRSKGPAVWALRAQTDKREYAMEMKKIVENTPNLHIREAMVTDILVGSNDDVIGVRTFFGVDFIAPSVVLTTGTFMNGKIWVGRSSMSAGRAGESASEGLTENLQSLGFETDRLKTGTPARVDIRSVDFSKMDAQPGDEEVKWFSNDPSVHIEREQMCCYLTRTTPATHKMICDNLHETPTYGGWVEAKGPRYCPSIEDKIVRFKDKETHQIFLEPEGRSVPELYVQASIVLVRARPTGTWARLGGSDARPAAAGGAHGDVDPCVGDAGPDFFRVWGRFTGGFLREGLVGTPRSRCGDGIGARPGMVVGGGLGPRPGSLASRDCSIRVGEASGWRGFRSSAVASAKPKVGPSGSFSGHRYKGKRPHDKGVEPKAAVLPVLQEKADVVVDIFDGMAVDELASRLSQSVEVVRAVLTGIGEQGSSQVVPADAAELVALDFGFSIKKVLKHEDNATGELPRSPVVTVMGHVDHGKTTLLDALRQTSLAAREAGGITQHLGAFVVNMPSGASLTFLDTPGHAAFSAMRARGTAVTDIVVLVVAADDGVMPQTLEAMSLAQGSGVPVVVAITKCDRVEANPARVRQQLTVQGVELEEIGGDVQVVEVSATEKSGLEKLEEALLLQAELMELRASSTDELHAVVVEARVDRGRGPLATVVVRSGNLVTGAIVVIGTQWGRIRLLKDMQGRPVPSAGPSTPVEIDGLRGLPEAGDYIQIVASEERARKLSQLRRTRVEEKRMWHLKRRVVAAAEAASAENGAEECAASEKREMTLILKADVQGTAEAVSQALTLLSCPQVEVNIVHSSVGPISQSDVDLAASCRALIVGFNVGSMSSAIATSARLAKVQVLTQRVIYHLLEDVGALIVGMAPGVKEDQVAGQAEVLSVFELKGKGRTGKGATKIAGCRVLDGRLERAARIRVLRSGEVLFEGLMQSLKREQQDVDTVAKGVECGMILEEWVNFQVGDVVQCITDFRRMPKFVSSQNGSARIEC